MRSRPDADPATARGGQLTDDAARRLLARAAEIDLQRGTETSLAELRSAAEGAGISAEAFDAAVAEWRADAAPTVPGAAGDAAPAPARPAGRRRIRWGLFWASLVAVLLGLVFLRMVVPAPPVETTPVEVPAAPASPAPR